MQYDKKHARVPRSASGCWSGPIALLRHLCRENVTLNIYQIIKQWSTIVVFHWLSYYQILSVHPCACKFNCKKCRGRGLYCTAIAAPIPIAVDPADETRRPAEPDVQWATATATRQASHALSTSTGDAAPRARRARHRATPPPPVLLGGQGDTYGIDELRTLERPACESRPSMSRYVPRSSGQRTSHCDASSARAAPSQRSERAASVAGGLQGHGDAALTRQPSERVAARGERVQRGAGLHGDSDAVSGGGEYPDCRHNCS